MMNEFSDMNSQEEIQRQQIEGNTKMVEGQPNRDMQTDSSVESQKSEIAIHLGQDCRMLKIKPRIVAAIVISEETNPVFANSPSKQNPVLKSEKYYTFYSPLKAGMGTQEKPVGFATDSILNISKYLDRMSATFPVFGQDDLEEKTSKIFESISTEVKSLVLKKWTVGSDSSTDVPKFGIKKPVNQSNEGGFSVGSEALQNNETYEFIPVSDVFDIELSCNKKEGEFGIIEMYIDVSIVIKPLINYESDKKERNTLANLNSLRKSLAGIESECYLAIKSSEILSPEYLEVFKNAEISSISSYPLETAESKFANMTSSELLVKLSNAQ